MGEFENLISLEVLILDKMKQKKLAGLLLQSTQYQISYGYQSVRFVLFNGNLHDRHQAPDLTIDYSFSSSVLLSSAFGTRLYTRILSRGKDPE